MLEKIDLEILVQIIQIVSCYREQVDEKIYTLYIVLYKKNTDL